MAHGMATRKPLIEVVRYAISTQELDIRRRNCRILPRIPISHRALTRRRFPSRSRVRAGIHARNVPVTYDIYAIGRLYAHTLENRNRDEIIAYNISHQNEHEHINLEMI